MPMYYFHLLDRDNVVDTEGTDLPDTATARRHAASVARELTFGRSGMLHSDWSKWRMSVRDAAGEELFSVQLNGFIQTGSH